MGGRHPLEKSGKKNVRFSAASPMMIFPPLLLVFSTDSAVLRPCSCFPRPWPSLKPYFCMILWATVPLCENCSGVTKHTAQACTEFFHETITNYTCCVCLCVCGTHPMFARKELVGPGGERGRSESSNIGGGMAAFGPLAGRASSS